MLLTNYRIFQRCGFLLSGVCALLLFTMQPASAQESTTFTGEVVSTSRNTVTIRTTDGHYQLFVFDRGIKKPSTIATGSRVRITASGEEDGVRSASEVVAVQAGNEAAPASSTPVIPSEVRRVERQIERQARRFQVGVRAGVALDPELILIGVQSQVGPFFGNNIYFRPNVEFAYGEVTALFALNPEIVYRLPLSSRNARWATYFGIGPSFNFLHQNFERNNV